MVCCKGEKGERYLVYKSILEKCSSLKNKYVCIESLSVFVSFWGL